jgi:hypothetical protein
MTSTSSIVGGFVTVSWTCPKAVEIERAVKPKKRLYLSIDFFIRIFYFLYNEAIIGN